MTEIGICSFSFHRLLAAGKQDIFQYIKDCKELGCTQLDPWNAHLSDLKSGDEAIHAGHNPQESMHLTAAEDEYLERIKAAAEEAGLPFGCIAVDGAHIYDPDPAVRDANRARAYRWLDVAHKLGAKQVRIDAGGTAELPDDQLEIIKEGFEDILSKASPLGIQVLIENHWGSSVDPGNVIRILDAVPNLGFLHDLHNWRPEIKEEGRQMLASRTDAIHLKTFEFDEAGDDPGEKAREALQMMKEAGYVGVWGVESVPKDGDEIEAARKTIALIKSVVEA